MKRFVATLLALGVPAFALAATVNLGAPAGNVVVIDPLAAGAVTNLGAPASNVVIIDPNTGGPAIGPLAYPPIADNVIALPNMVGKTTGVACIVGDSTATPGPTYQVSPNTNGVDPSQMPWGMLTEKLKHDVPGVTWTFNNFAIGATNENNWLSTGDTLIGAGNGNINANQTPWFSPTSSTWSSFVKAANCDVLFMMFGTNAASAGGTGGNGAATYIRNNLEEIQTWTKTPKIVFVTNKNANPANDSSGDDANLVYHKAQAAFHRTLALTNAAGYTSFSNVTALGLGLVDLGRYFTARIDGHDPAAQYFQSKPSCIVNGLVLGAIGSTQGTQSSTVCTTTHGDFRLTFVFPGVGGADLFAYGGTLQVGLGYFNANYARFSIGSGGNIVPRYVLDGSTSAAPTQTGTSVATTAGKDTTITITASGTRYTVVICSDDATVLANCTTSLDVDAPRFVTEASGGTPINIGYNVAPTGSPTINITEFWEGIGYPTQTFSSYALAMGNGALCNVTAISCQGGNGNNHQRANSAALDRQVIDALRFQVSAGINAGTVTTTGTPASGNLTKFSGLTSVTNGNLSGDCTTTDTLAITCTKFNGGTAFGSAAGVATGTSGATIPLLNGNNTASGTYTNSTNGAASTPAVTFSGTPYAAGDGTSNYPLVYANCSGSTQPSTLATAGSFFGVNSCSGFAGRFIDFHVNGAGSLFSIGSTGLVTGTGGITITSTVSLNTSTSGTTNIGTGTGSGNITIGNSGNTGKTILAGLATGTNADTLCLSSGGVVLLQAAACTISSARFKEDIRTFTGDALAEILRTPVYSFRLKATQPANRDPNARAKQAGLIAEDVARTMPECALYERDMKTPKSYRQECAIALSFRAIQQQQSEIDWLKFALAVLALWSAGLTFVVVRRSGALLHRG